MEDRKVYRHLTATSGNIIIDVNGKRMPIKFKHGVLRAPVIYGCIITDDKDIQNAIEANPGYNKDFILESINGEFIVRDVDTVKESKEFMYNHNILVEKYKSLLSDYNDKAVEYERLKILYDNLRKKVAIYNKKEVKEEAQEEIKKANSPTIIVVQNFQEAKSILKEKYDVPLKRMPNDKAIENRASELGIILSIDK